MPGEICHVEISTTDAEKSRALLSALFGWKFTPMGDTYWLWSVPDGDLGGGLDLVEKFPAQGGVQVYVHVDSIDDALAKAVDLGGEAVTPRTEIGSGHGFFAHLKDPGGAVIGLWQPTHPSGEGE